MAAQFSSTRLIKAQRKPHVCTHCRGIIPTGDPAEVTAFSCDEEFGTWRYHLDCKAAWNEIYRLTDTRWDEGLPPLWEIDGLREDFMEYLKADYPAVAARLFGLTKAGA